MKKQLLGLMTILTALGACQKNEVTSLSEDVTIHATIEEKDATRTVMDENNNILWSENDQIIAFMKSSYGYKYQVKPAFVGKSYADFSMVSSGNGSDLSAGNEWGHNVVYYPYSENIECLKSGANYALEVNLPAEQVYVPDSFANGSMAMVAVSENNNITFKNILGGIKLQLKGTQKVASIKIEGKNNEKLSGSATVTAYTDENKPAITMASCASTSVTLNCGEGVQLNESTATDFIISLPPVLFSKGFSVTVTDGNGKTYTVGTDKANTVLRSSLLVMPESIIEDTLVNPEEDIIDLSADGTANCYIVSSTGSYKFTPTKGNSNESVGTINSAEVLWETFGTEVTPNVGDLVKNVKYADGVINFDTPEDFKEGNAVIAAKDASGNILWSWHIWMTDQPKDQIYYNNAGTMMDRNLGATSTTPGDVGALGLFYQWGRKDPFLGASNISSNTHAKATNDIANAVKSNSSTGTISFGIKNPTTFICSNYYNSDWYYTGSSTTENTRWTVGSKSIYDPCPIGYRVPDGGKEGLWSKAYGKDLMYIHCKYDKINLGANFSGMFGNDPMIWYPIPGLIGGSDGKLSEVGTSSLYWSCTPKDSFYTAYTLSLGINDYFVTTILHVKATGQPVRCVQE